MTTASEHLRALYEAKTLAAETVRQTQDAWTLAAHQETREILGLVAKLAGERVLLQSMIGSKRVANVLGPYGDRFWIYRSRVDFSLQADVFIANFYDGEDECRGSFLIPLRLLDLPLSDAEAEIRALFVAQEKEEADRRATQKVQNQAAREARNRQKLLKAVGEMVTSDPEAANEIRKILQG